MLNRRELLATQSLLGFVALVGCATARAPLTASSATASDPTGDQRADYLRCLGGPLPVTTAPVVEVRGMTRGDGFRIVSVRYDSPLGDQIPALLLIPDRATVDRPAPGIAVWHQHNGEYHLGKSEPAGLAGNPAQHTGAALAREGYVVICPDALAFEERQDASGRLKRSAYEKHLFMREIVRGRSLAWRNIVDMRRALDVVSQRPEVRADRLGCYGHSMGSTHAWLLGPLEPRLSCVVGNCCLPTYEAIETHLLVHCYSNYVPGWLQHGDTPEIAALTAPRALHLNLGERDDGSPIASAEAGIRRIAAAYRAAGVADRFSAFIEPGVGHELTPAMWDRVRTVFARHLTIA
jgi:dienelactone hydrolase